MPYIETTFEVSLRKQKLKLKDIIYSLLNYN